MRFVLSADTHGYYPDIPKGDVLIHAGDFSSGRGSMAQLKEFCRWIEAAPCKKKIVIAGNHDFVIDKHGRLARKTFDWHGIQYLQDYGCYVGGVGNYPGLFVYGSPWHPKIWGKFELERSDLAMVWDMVPDYTDVLVTHGPPFGVLDQTNEAHGNDQAGDKALLMRVTNLEPKLHVFGHIHEGFGRLNTLETVFVNASFCDADYQPRNAIVEVDIPYVKDKS